MSVSTELPLPKGLETEVTNPASEVRSFQDVVVGEKAFYHQPDYVEATKRDFSVSRTLPASYVWNTQSKIVRIAKMILSIVVFPILIYQIVHKLAGKLIVAAATPQLMELKKDHAHERRQLINLQNCWKYKRIGIEVDGYQIDAMIVGQAATFGNGRWFLASNGNVEFYETKLLGSYEFKQILTQTHSNAIVFNYPGVGASSGMPNRVAMTKAYRAILSFLEDKEKGIGAKEIIGYGESIGGGVQGDALRNHPLKNDVKYVFVKKMTFSQLSPLISSLVGKPLGLLSKFFGWDMGSVESSKKLQAPEIIIQKANVSEYEELKDSSKIMSDGLIGVEESLAKILLDDPECPKENKLFIGVPEEHGLPLENPLFIANKINYYLSR